MDRIRQLAHSDLRAKVISQNSFPKSTGLSSSGSGFAALTFAASKALGLNLSAQELSILTRQGSGTACRCAASGFVEWKDGESSESSYSHSLFPKNHLDIRDVIAVVDEGKKEISSTAGHESAQSSPFFAVRQENIKAKIKLAKKYLLSKKFTQLGELVEAECLEFHSILMTSQPYLLMWYPGSLQVMHAVRKMRQEGIEAYFTINTGFNVHVLTLPKFEQQVNARLQKLSLVKKTLLAQVGAGPQELTKHLF